MIGVLRYRLRRAARKTALGAAGLVFILVGVGFLTAAAWIGLSLVADTLTAALVIGGAYAGLGLILLGIAATGSRHHTVAHAPTTHPTPTADEAFAGMSAAFLQGMTAGQAARDGFDRARH